jgi:putative ABC transport system permease protein
MVHRYASDSSWSGLDPIDGLPFPTMLRQHPFTNRAYRIYPGRVVSTLEQQMDEFVAMRSFRTMLIAMFSAAALILATIGIFGLMHYSVLQRRREIGVRLALGAQPAQVLRLLMSQRLRLVVVGAVAGATGGVWLIPSISAPLYRVNAADPVSWLCAVGILLLASAAACYLPARKAAIADPLRSLHET